MTRVIKSRIKWLGHVARRGEERRGEERRGEIHRVLIGKLEGKSPLGRHTHRQQDNIKTDP
jgi:hypothetical protein